MYLTIYSAKNQRSNNALHFQAERIRCAQSFATLNCFTDYASRAAQAYENIESKPAEADQLAWIRPVAPFLPKSQSEYFEEEPDDRISKFARRDSRLDALGTDADDDEPVEARTADVSEGRRRR